MRYGQFLIILLCVYLVACATTKEAPGFSVYVNSIVDSQVKPGKRYMMLPADPEVKPGDLQYREHAAQLQRLLNVQGFQKVSEAEQADILIFLAYGIGDPEQHIATYSVPTFGATGVTSSYTTGTANTYGNTTTYSGTTQYNQSYGITGYRSQVRTYTTHTRWAIIDAIDMQRFLKTKNTDSVWEMTLTSTGSSGDLRRVFPVMVAASAQYLARPTHRAVLVELKEESPVVRLVRGLPPMPPS
jgi:hypothetical protein